jgi:putative two-component system response regulator
MPFMFSNDRLLAVDDNVTNLIILTELLGDSYMLKCVTSGEEALRVAPSYRPNVVLLDLMMPVLDGNDTCRQLCAQPELSDMKVVMLSAKADLPERLTAYQAGAVDYIAKPFDHREVLAKVHAWTDMVHRQQVDKLWHDLETMGNGVGVTLTSLIRLRDTETGNHIFRMQWYSQLLAEQLAIASPYSQSIDETFLRNLYRSSPLHDIGKVGVDDAVLRKPARLTPSEFEAIKLHTSIGAELLGRALVEMPNTEYLRMAIEIAKHHHERFDGTGYPDGLVGARIPLAARIVSVSDVFDALTSDRVYHKAVSPEEAMRIIQEGAGTQFDPGVVEALVARFEDCVCARLRWNGE